MGYKKQLYFRNCINDEANLVESDTRYRWVKLSDNTVS